MDLSHVDGRYIEVLRMIAEAPGIRQSAIVGRQTAKETWRQIRLDMLVEDGLVTSEEIPHRGRYGYVREFSLTERGHAVLAKVAELESL